jgi:hypothetical protein
MAGVKRALSVGILLFCVLFSLLSRTSATPVKRQTTSFSDTALVIAVSDAAADEAVSLLNQYNQTTEVLVVAQNGTDLPSLETVNGSSDVGNFGLIVIIGLASYDYGGTTGWASAITPTQWSDLYAYQLKYGVRMIHLDGYPGNFPGTALALGPGGCCSAEDQYVSLLDTSFVPTDGQAVSLSTVGLWHYPATVTDFTTTTPFLGFASNSEYPSPTVAGVIQNIGGREQMVFFIAGGSWSWTTNYLGHIWFRWGYGAISNTLSQTALVVATDANAAGEATYILGQYNQSYQLLAFPQTAGVLPSLQSFDTSSKAIVGNFGLIIVISLASYDYGGTTGWASSITTQQWATLYAYQSIQGVRMVHLDGYPANFPGTTLAPGPIGCCASEEQYVYPVDTPLVSAAGLSVANLSTLGLWHYPATITDNTTTTDFIDFGANSEFSTPTVAGVLQNFNGRQQMVFFLTGASWSSTTGYLGGIWFYWGYGTQAAPTNTMTTGTPTTTTTATSTSSSLALTSPLSVFTEVYSGYCIPYNNTLPGAYLDYGTGNTLDGSPNFVCAQHCRKHSSKR